MSFAFPGRSTRLVSPPPKSVDQQLRMMPLKPAEHLDFVTKHGSASFLQCPSWADLKTQWSAERLGWVDGAGTVVGAGQVLYRRVPRVDRYLAYIPEGPLIDWSDGLLHRWLEPLFAHLRRRRAFGVTMGPPLVVRGWQAATLKRAAADGSAARLGDVPPDFTNEAALDIGEQLQSMGWSPTRSTSRGSTQSRLVFEVPLAGRGRDDIWSGLSQRWRRSIRKAERAGVEVTIGGYDDLPEFYRLLQETQRRDGFDLGRSLEYYRRQYRSLSAEDPERMRLFLARYRGETLAAHTLNRVGDRAWYQLGASASHRRELCPSHLLQWRMIQAAKAAGCSVYDMRGFDDTLDVTRREHGLLQWKLGTGGRAVEYLGEWDFPLNQPLHKLFGVYLAWRRSA
ncbi:peptidoglycan bridge formation glycyltransferase FemY [Kribbella sancticallisti]|uniref:Peptidoglycan bridge formation glycyltransferase FemY n=1 Tax=Kribbella sancticallisti TaxID=460087 RepID=A0ABN2DMY9_9ACTN